MPTLAGFAATNAQDILADASFSEGHSSPVSPPDRRPLPTPAAPNCASPMPGDQGDCGWLRNVLNWKTIQVLLTTYTFNEEPD